MPALWKIIRAEGKDADGLIEYSQSDLAIRTSVERYRPFYERISGGNI